MPAETAIIASRFRSSVSTIVRLSFAHRSERRWVQPVEVSLSTCGTDHPAHG